MADNRENLQEEDQRRRQGKKSRSIEEIESSSYYDFSERGRKQNVRWIESRRRSDERNEIDSRFRAEKKDREGQIHDYRDSSNQQQQRLRDVEMQRRRYETDSRIWRNERDRSPRRYDGRAPPNESEWRYDERSGRRYEQLQLGGYRIHPGKNDCYSYFRTGTCFHGRSHCKFNHPTQLPQEIPEMTTNVPVCKYFQKGYCNKGSECGSPHTMGRDGAEPMPQDRPMDWRVSDSESRFDVRTERRYKTESGYRPEKMSRTIPDSRKRDPRGTFEDIRQRHHEIEPESKQERRYETESGYRPEKRSRTIPDSLSREPKETVEDISQRRHEIEPEPEQERREIPENRFMAAQRARERREAQGNMQEQRSGGRIKDLSHLINPIAEGILRERMRKIENDKLSREESPMRSSQQSNLTK